MKTKFLLIPILTAILSLSAIADDEFTTPPSPLSMNTFNASLRKQLGIVETIYQNPEFKKKMNQLREEVGPNRALMVIGYAANATPIYAHLTLRLGVYELGQEIRNYGELDARVSRSNVLQIFDLTRVR